MIATIAAFAEKSSAIVAIIWKPLFSDRSDRSDRCHNDRWDRPQFYLNDRSDRWDHMETTLQRLWRSLRWKIHQNAVRRCLFQVLSGIFLNSVAIVAILWKLVVVRIAHLFCKIDFHMIATIATIASIVTITEKKFCDRCSHMETTLQQ